MYAFVDNVLNYSIMFGVGIRFNFLLDPNQRYKLHFDFFRSDYTLHSV